MDEELLFGKEEDKRRENRLQTNADALRRGAEETGDYYLGKEGS